MPRISGNSTYPLPSVKKTSGAPTIVKPSRERARKLLKTVTSCRSAGRPSDRASFTNPRTRRSGVTPTRRSAPKACEKPLRAPVRLFEKRVL